MLWVKMPLFNTFIQLFQMTNNYMNIDGIENHVSNITDIPFGKV